MPVEQILLLLISCIGTLILYIITQISSQIKELKAEIEILKTLNSRIAKLEEFQNHFGNCINFKIK